MTGTASAPWGIRVMERLLGPCCSNPNRRTSYYRAFVLVATFLAYTCYHMTRRPLSIVKSVLNEDCRFVAPDPSIIVTQNTSRTWCDWAPFVGDQAPRLYSYLDSSYLFAYAICMFVSGFVAERMHLRYFLALGLLMSALTTHLFGLGYSLKIHNFGYYFVVQLIGGAFQSTGWPSVVTCVGNWFGKSKRGLIFGVWNAHTSVGNIVGAYVAGVFVSSNWGLSFVVPAAICGFVGVLVALFLTPYPEEVNCDPPRRSSTSLQASLSSTVATAPIAVEAEEEPRTDSDESSLLLPEEEQQYLLERKLKRESDKKAVTFIQALCIPGVIDFSLALFFAKLVSYTFLFWLPFYIHASTTFDSAHSAFLSTLFDFGGIAGGILAGYLSDRTGASALICGLFLTAAIPMMFIYEVFGSWSLGLNMFLQFLAGLFINGPYALITTAVSAELGTHLSVSGNAKALATVTAIIDGTGSIGAAVGPLIAGLIVSYGWNTVFYMVMIADLLATICLLRVIKQEVVRLRTRRVMALQ
ncbi:solute carrier, putative [Ixodes scapularis]|uniref:Sugar phosphate exchanger 3 n=1 Tax=Ixodes scapularis TaxID=6945 RepID=B7P1P9_IXOSC|nr:solute carrier, putative [Ixodes scapularis]|eukprot:XP_002433457.1 solute carrier, putative [Ixodes scapularis]